MLHNRCTSVLQVCDCHAKWSSVYHIQFYLEGSWRSWYCNVQHGILCIVDTALLWTQRHDCCKSTHLFEYLLPGIQVQGGLEICSEGPLNCTISVCGIIMSQYHWFSGRQYWTAPQIGLQEYWVYRINVYKPSLQSLQAFSEVSIVGGFSIGAPIGGLLQSVRWYMMCIVWVL